MGAVDLFVGTRTTGYANYLAETVTARCTDARHYKNKPTETTEMLRPRKPHCMEKNRKTPQKHRKRKKPRPLEANLAVDAN